MENEQSPKEFLDGLKKKSPFLYASYVNTQNETVKVFILILNYEMGSEFSAQLNVLELSIAVSINKNKERQSLRIAYSYKTHALFFLTGETQKYWNKLAKNSVSYIDFLTLQSLLSNIAVSDAFETLFEKEKE